MSVDAAVSAGLQDAILPIGHRHDRPRRPWHASYLPGTPPGVDYPHFRVEEVLARAAERFPDRSAILFGNTRWSYASLLHRVQRAAANLGRLGVGKGDRVLFVLPNCPEFLVAWFACHWAGVEVVPANPLNSGPDLVRMYERSRAKLVIGLDLRLEPCIELSHHAAVPHMIVVSLARHLPIPLQAAYRLRNLIYGADRPASSTKVHDFSALERRDKAILARPVSNDIKQTAVLQPTGGTTGVPKLAMLTHENLIANVSQYFTFANRAPGTDSVLGVLPFFHIYGTTVVMLGSIAHGATIVLQPRFDVKRLLAVIDKHRPTIAPLVPFMYVALIDELKRRKRKIGCFDICSSGASSLEQSVRDEFYELTGVTIAEGYGLSECSPVVTASFPGTHKPGTVGVPIPDTEIKIVDVDTGAVELGFGEVGELCVRGPQVMQGYLDDPRETEIALRGGWLYTGDLASMDPDGYLRIVDRKKDMIISGGLNIFPSEVEAAIAEFPGVAQCAVVGEPDRKWGQRVIAWIVPEPGATIATADLERHCRERLAHYKIPREFRATETLPVSFLGKVLRAKLRHPTEVGGPLPPGEKYE